MRIDEVIKASVTPMDEVIDEIITSFVALGKERISTAKLANHLTSKGGVTVTPDTLVPLITNHPMVKSADEKVVVVGNTVDDEYSKASGGDDEDRVSQMADGAVDLGD